MFAVNKEQYGYDANFVENVSEEHICTICKMVLRKPIQIMTCGHRFCSPCFGRLKVHSEINQTLTCPLDNKIINLGMVFEDVGIARTIGNLEVKCGNHKDGCVWTGDLRDLQMHEEGCKHRVDLSQLSLHANKDDTNAMVKELLQRVESCEESLITKEKDLAHLKFNLHDLKENFNKKEHEVENLKMSNMQLQRETNLLRTLNEEVKKQFQDEVETLKNGNKQMGAKVVSLEDEVLQIKETLKDGNRKTLLLKNLMETNNACVDGKLTSCNNDMEYVKSQLNQPQTQALNDDMLTLKDQVNKIEEAAKAKQIHVEKSLHEKTSEITAINTRLGTIDQSTITDSCVNHIENIENILFSYDSFVNKNIKFRWVMQDFKSNFNIGEDVHSPIFCTNIDGYCVQLLVGWRGQNKEKLCLYLKLHRGKDKNNILPEYNHECTFHIMNNKGGKKTQKITQEYIDRNRDDFTIHNGESMARDGWGDTILTSPYDEYIINDSLYISCTLHL